MHYRNGREAKNGDVVIQIDHEGKVWALGTLEGAEQGAGDYCNGKVVPIQTAPIYACLVDCLHVDDVAEMLKDKGLDTRPAGK